MISSPATPEAYKLFHEGVLALADVEANGIRIDTAYLDKAILDTNEKIRVGKINLEKDDVWKLWKKEYGPNANMGSGKQLGQILFEKMGFKCTSFTATGQMKVDQTSLENVDLPFVKEYFKVKKLEKTVTTYLEGIRREVVNGFLHPFFNLHTAKTYRSSSSNPNFQNIPVRNKWMKEIIRRSIIARKGCCIIETDFKGIEVCVTSCYNLDPVLIKYIKNPKLDMHRDMAAKCFMVKPEEVSGDMRYAAKNMFVFPEFYGSYYIDCARNLWEAIPKLALCTSDGRDMAGVLQTAGISKLGACRAEQPPKRGTFEAHIKEVEDWLWNEQFTGYRDWKKSWYRQYLKQGYVETLTGFVLSDVVKRNDIINHPVQGSAFHCLLWTLITLNKQIKKRKMKTKIIGQIHDSIVADVPEKEVQDYLGLVKHVVEVMLPEHWKWIIVPMGVEAEASPINGSWYEKAKVDM